MTYLYVRIMGDISQGQRPVARIAARAGARSEIINSVGAKEFAVTDTHLVWGEINNEAVFGPAALVKELGALRMAIGSAETWGKFRTQVSTERMREIVALMENVPADDAAFAADELPGFADGDWPEWLHQEMLGWMPQDLITRFGTVEDSVLNGQFLSLPKEVGETVAHELELRGWSCLRDDDAVSLAAGWG